MVTRLINSVVSYSGLIMRDIFHIKPKYQSITQGSIITGCIADEISINNVWGCIITARCDLDNKKVQRVHYLPIISFDDWLKYCASTSIKEAWKKSLFSHLRNALKNHDLSPSFMSKGLSRSDLEIIIDSFFNKKEVKSFWEAYDNLSLSDSIPLSEIINSPQGIRSKTI